MYDQYIHIDCKHRVSQLPKIQFQQLLADQSRKAHMLNAWFSTIVIVGMEKGI